MADGVTAVPDGEGGSKKQIALAALGVSALILAVSFFRMLLMPWPEEAFKRVWTGALGIAVLIAVALLIYLLNGVAALTDFGKRLKGPDAQTHRPGLRFFVATWWASYRCVFRCKNSPQLRRALLTIGLSAIVTLGLRLYIGEGGQHPWQMYLAIAWILFLLIFIPHTIWVGYSEGIKELPSEKLLEGQILRIVHNWRGKVSDAHVHAARIAVEDAGIIRIMATNFVWLTRPLKAISDDKPVLDFAWTKQGHGDKKLNWLVANPLNKDVRARNRRLNGRFIEYYAKPFLRVLLRWQEENKGSKRIDLKIIDGMPSYRMLMSDNRVVVQMYPWVKHGRDEAPYVLFRVLRAYELHDKLKSWLDASQTEKEIDAATLGASLQDGLTQWLDECVTEADKYNIYGRFRRAFDISFHSAKPAKPIDTWDAGELAEFAKSCGVPKNRLAQVSGDSRQIADVLCAKLGLETELNKAR